MNRPDHSCIMDEPINKWDFAMHLDNTLEALWPLAEAVEIFGQESGWTDALIMQVNLVLEELLVNAITNGYPDQRSGHITVQIQTRLDAITLQITDDGDAFDPFSIQTPDLSLAIEDRPIGGLGVHLVRSYMDVCHYRYIRPYNEVILTKHLAAKPTSAT